MVADEACAVFPFAKSPEALQYLYEGGHFGKVVIKVSNE